jgi:hypothetical protein
MLTNKNERNTNEMINASMNIFFFILKKRLYKVFVIPYTAL